MEVAVTAPAPDPDLEWWQRPMERPPSVTAAGAILWVLAGLALLGICALGAFAGGHRSTVHGPTLAAFLIVLVVVGIVDGLLGHNVLHGRRRARIAAIAFGCLNIALGILAIARGTPSGCVSIGLQAVIIGLLSTTAAGAYFRNPV